MTKQPLKHTQRYTKAQKRAEEEIDRYLRRVNTRTMNVLEELMNTTA